MKKNYITKFAVLFFAAAVFQVSADDALEASVVTLPDDPVGLTLKEVFDLYGMPDAVYTVRGAEEWQDDAVFVYTERKLDLYIYRDRVWQAGVQSALGVKKGDRKAAAELALTRAGYVHEDRGTHLLYSYNTTVWPKYARFNLDPSGRISEIFIYRPDY